jgi:DNA polymerase III subunit chi
MDVYFYHLESKTLEDTLPDLLERTLARGWRAQVRPGSDERAKALDAHLWTYREESFLPHGLAAEPNAADQPILITLDAADNDAQALFLVDGADPGDWDALRAKGYERIVLMFDGRDADAVTHARVHWKNVKASGLAAQYWQQSPAGKWEKKA